MRLRLSAHATTPSLRRGVDLAVATHIVKAPPLTISIALLFSLSGCVVPFPSRDTLTPELSGRVVDFASRSPLPKSTITFLQAGGYTALPKPTATTDAAGRFHVPRTVSQHAIFVFFGAHGSFFWPDAPHSRLLQIQHTGYATKTLDLDAAFKAGGVLDPHRSVDFDILEYDRLVPLGDIPLKR